MFENQMTTSAQASDKSSKTVEGLLDRLDSLPSPGPVALNLISILESDATTTRQVVDLIASDPALTARVIATCARSERGRACEVTSLERAVVLLGFDTVRTTALSVRIAASLWRDADLQEHSSRFDIDIFWRHALAVAVLSQRIAEHVAPKQRAAAFVAGLLHDIGHLALHVIAPRSFQSVCEIAEAECSNIDIVAARRIGLDGPTAGRRLASNWKLPSDLEETIWLHAQPIEVLRKCEASELAMIVSLADGVIARDHVCLQEHGTRTSALEPLAIELGITMDKIDGLRAEVLHEVQVRAEAIGIDAVPPTELLLNSLSRANAMLSRFALAFRDRAMKADRHERTTQAIEHFQNAESRGSVLEVAGAIAASAQSFIPASTACLVIPPLHRADVPRVLLHGDNESKWVQVGTGCPGELARDVLSRHGLVPCGASLQVPLDDDTAAILALGRSVARERTALSIPATVLGVWSQALASALDRERSTHLADRLAQANREVALKEDALTQARADSTVNVIAAGAAHELNNPLAIIAGRASLLARCLDETELAACALEIEKAANRAAQLVRALSESTERLDVDQQWYDVGKVLADSCAGVDPRERARLSIRTDGTLPEAFFDGELVAAALYEGVANALHFSTDEVIIEGRVVADRLLLAVIDRGAGFSESALEHAVDPFFSEHPAGRQEGLGLSRASRVVDAHGGTLHIRNGARGGGVFTLSLPCPVRTDKPSVGSSAQAA